MVLTESAGLVIMFTVPLFLQGSVSLSAFSWDKLPPKPVYGILGENVTLEWSFTLTYSETLDDFTLYRNRQRMVKYDENGLVFYGTFKESVGLVGNGTPSFILTNLKKADDGVTYCCYVNTKLAPSGSHGNNYEKCTLLEIVVRPNITSISSNRTVNETSDVTLSCSANGTPHPNITWSKVGEANKTLGTGSFLSLKNISREQDGFYQCLADNGVGKAVASMRIVVQFAPSISIVGGSYNITEGRDLVLRCSSDGRPVPIVTWSKMKFSNIRFPPGHQLKIRNISRTEAGVYICTAANGIGQNVNAKMDVNVLYPPSIVEGNHVITLNESENLRLVCHATGHPQPMVQWSKSPNPGLMESIDGVLAVKNVTKSDAGTYECRASNGIGNDKVLSTVTVNYKPQGIVLRTNTTENAAIEGASVTFVCSADSVPPSVYELRFKASSMGDSNNGIFTIQQVKASHQGTYKCAARNILGIGAVATLHLDVLRPPSIDFISQNATANETNDVILFCNATGNPPPNITWTSLNDPDRRVLTTGDTLTLSNVTRDQSGTYQCVASNGLISAKTANVYVQINFRPNITSISSNRTVNETSDVTLFCSANGTPHPNITWSKAGEANKSLGTGSLLSLKNISREQDGFYQCLADNGVGKAVASMRIVVQYPPSIVEGNHVITLNESENLRLVCHATGNPQPMIQWSKRPNPGLMESIDGVLAVKNVTKSDAGTYECRASNGIGNDKVLSTVSVNYKPQGIVLRANTTENAAIEGASVTFVCSADSVPPSVYELRFKPSLKSDSNNGIFTIQQVQASHQGTYKCAARNILGIGAVATLHLNVLRPPSIDFISHNATANETNDVILFCNATGNPPPNITWTSLNDPDRRVLTTGDTLTLSNVTRDQSGTYQCVASNGLISAKTANVYVQINYKPEFIDEASANVVSWLNHETQIGCVAKGVPAPEIKWDRNGTVMSFRQSAELISNLTFTPKEKKDFGSYTCTARNPLGSTKRKVTVVMLAQPEAPQSLRIEPEFDNLEIHWSPSSVPSPTGPVLDYLAQVREKDEAEGWINCTQQRNQSLLMCVIKNLKSSTVYIVRVAGRNVVGYSEFIEQEVRTKATDKDDEHDELDGNNKDDEHDEHDADDGGKTTVEDRPKEIGELERHQGQSGYTVDAIIGGVISFSSLVVMIVAIVTQRRKCLVEKAKYNVNSRRNVEANGHDNNAFAENPRNDETEEEV